MKKMIFHFFSGVCKEMAEICFTLCRIFNVLFAVAVVIFFILVLNNIIRVNIDVNYD